MAYFSYILCSAELPYTTLCYIASSFILPWNFRVRLYYAAASQPRVFASLFVGHKTNNYSRRYWKLKKLQ